MIVNDKDLIFNINTLICLPKIYEDMARTYEYNFKYVYIFDNTDEGANNFINFINKNNVKEVVLVDYRMEYERIIDTFRDKVIFNILFTIDIASLSDEIYLGYHDSAVSMYKDGKINKFGVLDKNLYLITKPKFEETYLIKLDEPKMNTKEAESKNGIGLLNASEDPKHSFYNELSAINLNGESANIIHPNKITKGFIKEFGVNAKEFNSINEIINASEITLYVNFCNTNNSLFLRSMDANTICILGNNSIINDNEYLSKMLQVKSDDDINEIAEKIGNVRTYKQDILEEYSKFRKEYSAECKDSISKFVIGNNSNEIVEEYEKILTIGIPVYNVEKYVKSSIQSVLDAIDENMEILIVNDGSTDNSEEIVLEYAKKYPDIIRYIKQENHGLGNVRNVILKNSKGKYIASVDSDDTINKDFFKDALKYMEDDVDVILCDWLSITQGEKNYVTEAVDKGLDIESLYKKLFYSTIMPSSCNKIIKKDLYSKLKLTFVEGHKFEDLGTNPIILNHAETIKYLNKPYYEYNIRENSIMRSSVGYNMIDILKILEDRFNNQNIKIKVDKQEFLAYVFFWRIEDSIINQLYNLDIEERNKMIDYIYKNLYDILKCVYDNNEYVNSLISRVDKPTQEFIIERNKKIVDKSFKEYINKKIETKTYKILTPALILYNYDNRNKGDENA